MPRALSAASLLAVVLLHGFGCSTKELYVRTASGAEACVGHFETGACPPGFSLATVSGSILPGQRITAGTRKAPSQFEFFS